MKKVPPESWAGLMCVCQAMLGGYCHLLYILYNRGVRDVVSIIRRRVCRWKHGSKILR